MSRLDTDPEPKLLKGLPAAAEYVSRTYFECSPKTIKHWVYAKGDLPFYKIAGCLFFDPADIDDCIAAQKHVHRGSLSNGSDAA